jgi:hypothetical protein
MTISAFIYRFDPRHRLTDEERKNLRDYHRRNRVQSPAIMTAALGGHPYPLRGQR